MHYGLLSSFQRRSHRGAILLVTVLVVLVAATITAVTIQVAVVSSSSQQRRLSQGQASAMVQSIDDRIRADIEQDPLLMYSEVLADEIPRICVADLTAYPNPIVAGSAWPASCGSTWTYDGMQGLTAGAMIHPPSPTASELTVDIFASDGGQQTGFTASYVLGGRSRPLIYSGSNLNMSSLGNGVGVVTADAPVYANGVITVGASVLGSKVILAAENGFAVLPAGDSQLAVPAGTSAGDTPVDIRNVYPAKLSGSPLASALTALNSVGCLDTTPSNYIGVDNVSVSSTLCLRAGRTSRSTSNVSITLPSGGAAYVALLLVPLSDGTLKVFGRMAEPLSWPGTLASWGNPIGIFYVPSSGLVITDTTTVLGLCAPVAALCANWGTAGIPGATINKSFTLVVGSLASPSDLLIGGPLSFGTGVVGALVSGSVYVPIAATPENVALTIDLWLAVVGATGGSLFSSAPR